MGLIDELQRRLAAIEAKSEHLTTWDGIAQSAFDAERFVLALYAELQEELGAGFKCAAIDRALRRSRDAAQLASRESQPSITPPLSGTSQAGNS